MRTIKFRGKRVDNGEWVCGDFIKKYPLFNAHEPVPVIYQNDRFYEVIPETVGQFTGLTDKNGAEIYEGDIFKRILDKNKKFDLPDDFSDYWLVEWLYETSGFTTTRIGDLCGGVYIKKNPSRNSFSQRFKEADEVIGNIHDNPELIKN